jgi:transcriptional regulator with XRE-family HTH domain
MSTRKQQLNELIKDKDFRREFVSDYVQEMLAVQIKELREHRQWTQQELGDAAEGMKQAQVSRLENPDYSGATINSLKRLANAFDLGLVVSFVRFSEFLDRITTQSPLRLVPPSYDEEQQQLSFAGFTGENIWPSGTGIYFDESGDYGPLQVTRAGQDNWRQEEIAHSNIAMTDLPSLTFGGVASESSRKHAGALANAAD